MSQKDERDLLPAEAREVLDRLRVRPLIEYVCHDRLHVTNAHSEITFAFTGPNLTKTKLSHLQIGNVELERLGELLAGTKDEPS